MGLGISPFLPFLTRLVVPLQSIDRRLLPAVFPKTPLSLGPVTHRLPDGDSPLRPSTDIRLTVLRPSNTMNILS